MEKAQIIKKETMKCVNCDPKFTALMAHIPSNGDVYLRCLADYAQSEDKLEQHRPTEEV